MKNLLLILLFTTFIAACKKSNTVEDELAKLPAATQVGKNTFGCLVNGKAWVAQRDDCAPFVCDPPFKMLYVGANGGGVSIESKNINRDLNEAIVLSVDSTSFYNYFDIEHFSRNHMNFAFFRNYNFISAFDSNSVYSNGEIKFSKIDLSNRIISGTFKFTLYKIGWDTIKVTNGRFDGKLY